MIDAKIVGEAERPMMYNFYSPKRCENCSSGAVLATDDGKLCSVCFRPLEMIDTISPNPKLVDFLSEKFSVPKEVVRLAIDSLPPRIKIFHMLKAAGKEELMDDIMSEVSRT